MTEAERVIADLVPGRIVRPPPPPLTLGSAGSVPKSFKPAGVRGDAGVSRPERRSETGVPVKPGMIPLLSAMRSVELSQATIRKPSLEPSLEVAAGLALLPNGILSIAEQGTVRVHGERAAAFQAMHASAVVAAREGPADRAVTMFTGARRATISR